MRVVKVLLAKEVKAERIARGRFGEGRLINKFFEQYFASLIFTTEFSQYLNSSKKLNQLFPKHKRVLFPKSCPLKTIPETYSQKLFPKTIVKTYSPKLFPKPIPKTYSQNETKLKKQNQIGKTTLPRYESWPKNQGNYLLFRMFKERMDTAEAIALISRVLGDKDLKNFGKLQPSSVAY
jgi:hypothetical protein